MWNSKKVTAVLGADDVLLLRGGCLRTCRKIYEVAENEVMVEMLDRVEKSLSECVEVKTTVWDALMKEEPRE